VLTPYIISDMYAAVLFVFGETVESQRMHTKCYNLGRLGTYGKHPKLAVFARFPKCTCDSLWIFERCHRAVVETPVIHNTGTRSYQ